MAICGRLKQSTATTITLGPFVDETNGKDAEVALTLAQADIRLSKNDGAFAQVGEATTATHKEIGYYSKNLNTTDTGTLGVLTVAVHEAGALPIRQDYEIVPANIWDSWYGTDKQEVDVVQRLGVAVVLAAKRNTALNKFMFFMELTAGGPATGISVTAQISKDGGAFGGVTDPVTEIGNGVYEVDLSATEMDAKVIFFKATGTACKQLGMTIITEV